MDRRRSSQSILKEINPEYPWEGLMLKLKLQHLGQLMQRANSLENTPKLRKTEVRRRRDENEMVGWYHRLNGREFEQTPEVGEGQGNLVAAVCGVTESDTTERLNWRP